MELEFVKESSTICWWEKATAALGWCSALEKTLYFHPWQVSLTEFKLNKSERRNDLRSRWGGQTV